MPSSDNANDSLRIVQEQGGQWMAVAGLYFFASVALVVGLPSVLTLFDKRGSRTGLTALAVFTIGCVGIAGFAMLLAFFRALALNDTHRPRLGRRGHPGPRARRSSSSAGSARSTSASSCSASPC